MNIQKCSLDNTGKYNNSALDCKKSPSFKGVGVALLNGTGNLMQSIEDKGFWATFLIQDGLGMTAPRVGTGLLRDKEITGKYNIQEAKEVGGREGLTGPCMMAVAPISMAIAAKFGKTTSVNSQLIKRFGNNLKNIISNSNFDKAILNDKDKFKDLFYKSNIEQMLNNTLGKEHVTEDLISNILKEVKNIDSNPKEKKASLNKIVETINNQKYSTSDELNLLDKLKVGGENEISTYSTKDAIDAMMKYCEDAIKNNKQLNELDEIASDDIKNRAIAKRMFTNISTMAATLGVLSILPSLYIRSNISPGARTAMQMQEAQKQAENDAIVPEKIDTQNGEITFKGKPSKLGRLGEKISKMQKNEKVATEFEYNGHNFTNTLMSGLSLGGLLFPRGLKAYKRAQVDPDTGKKDHTEIYEIIGRDATSSLSVVFAVPMMTRACVTSYEKGTGFVLMDKNRNMTKRQTILNLLNPYSSAKVLTNSELKSLYNNVDTIDKMINFCKFIDKNNGDLEKILSKSDHVNEIFNDKTMQLSEVTSLSKKEKNKKILNFIENLEKNDEINAKIKKLMQGNDVKKSSKIVSFARGLNSIPAALATFLISPVILGWLIPRLTYENTKRIHEKQAKEKAKRLNSAA